MKTISTLLLFLGLNSVSFAESTDTSSEPAPKVQLEPVKEASLKLLGRGLENKETDENIALACVGDNSKNDSFEAGCDELRFVYYKNKNEVYFIGQTYHVESMSFEQAQNVVGESVKSERKVFKTVKSREVFNYEAATNEDQQKYRNQVFKKQQGNQFILSGLVLGSLAGTIGLIFTGVVAPLTGGVGLAIGVIYLIKWMDRKNDRTCRLTRKHRVVRDIKVKYYKAATTEVFNQNGWNWSSDPARISDRKFSKIFDALQTVQDPL